MTPIYVPNYLPLSLDRVKLFAELLSLNWEQRVNVRKEYFMGQNSEEYTYSNRLYKANPFSNSILNILNRLNEEVDRFNVCFLNRYDSQHDSLGWHSDEATTVAVISLGEEREIWWKEKTHKGRVPDHQKQKLEHGSLFIMPNGFQDIFVHKIPKNDRPCKTRISLTFRNLS